MDESREEARRFLEGASRDLEAMKEQYRVAGTLAAMIAVVSLLETYRSQSFSDFETTPNESHRVALDSFSDYIGELSARVQEQIGRLMAETGTGESAEILKQRSDEILGYLRDAGYLKAPE